MFIVQASLMIITYIINMLLAQGTTGLSGQFTIKLRLSPTRLKVRTWGRYNKHITIVNDASRVVNERCHNLEHHCRSVIDDFRCILYYSSRGYVMFIIQVSLIIITYIINMSIVQGTTGLSGQFTIKLRLIRGRMKTNGIEPMACIINIL